MSLLRIIGVCSLWLAIVPTIGAAQTGPLRTLVVVTATASDSRIQDVTDAVEFWNSVFAELGLRPAFGKTKVVSSPFSESILLAYSNTVVGSGAMPETPNELTRIPGDVVMYLSADNIVSFTIPVGNSARRIIGIRTSESSPLNIPNVSRNVIAHEIGHALGLGHNRDAAFLMCGRPTNCRPHEYRSDTPRFFPLTGSELSRLRRIFAPSDSARGSLD